jgi:hypothetical protein
MSHGPQRAAQVVTARARLNGTTRDESSETHQLLIARYRSTHHVWKDTRNISVEREGSERRLRTVKEVIRIIHPSLPARLRPPPDRGTQNPSRTHHRRSRHQNAILPSVSAG